MPPEQAVRSPRLFRVALLVWILLPAVVCVRSFFQPERSSVYPIFSEAARSWCRGEDCYRLAMHDHYRYSPSATALLVPFAVLPDSLGGVLWRLVGVTAFLFAMGWWVRAVLPRSVTSSEAGLMLLLVVPLSLGNLNNGQSNLLVLAALLASAAGVAEGRWNLAAAAATLACLFKGYPLAVALLFSALFPRQFAGRFAAGLVLGLALPLLFQQPDYVAGQYHSWFDHLRQDDRQQLNCDSTYRDIRLLFRVAGTPLSADGVRALQLAAGAGIFLMCLSGLRQGWPRRKVVGAALDLGCFWMVLLGPATESNTYVLLAPALAWSLLETARAPRPRVAFGLVSLGAFVLLTCCVAGWFPAGRLLRGLGLQPLGGTLVLLGVSLHLLSGRESISPEERTAAVPVEVVP
jgi:hypothetical protein